MTPDKMKAREGDRLEGISIVRGIDPYGDIRGDLRNMLMDKISLALSSVRQAERLRCAEIAEHNSWDVQDLDEEKAIVNRTCEEIAQAILNQKGQEGV